MTNTEVDQGPADQSAVEAEIGAKLFGGDQPDEMEQTEREVEAAEVVAEAEEQSVPDIAEVEYEGQKFQIPKALEKAIMQHGDYTRKTQELADQRRAVELTQQQFRIAQLNNEFESSVSQERQQAAVLDAYLARASQLNWSGMTTDEIVRAKMDLDNAKDARAKLDRDIEAKRSEYQQKIAKQYKDYLGQATQYLAKAIPGWTDATAKDIAQHALGDGYTQEELNNITDPRYVRTLWKAREFDRLQAERQQAKGKADSAPVLRPGAVNPMSPAVKQKLNYRKAVASAKTEADRQKIVRDRIGQIFGG